MTPEDLGRWTWEERTASWHHSGDNHLVSDMSLEMPVSLCQVICQTLRDEFLEFQREARANLEEFVPCRWYTISKFPFN